MEKGTQGRPGTGKGPEMQSRRAQELRGTGTVFKEEMAQVSSEQGRASFQGSLDATLGGLDCTPRTGRSC